MSGYVIATHTAPTAGVASGEILAANSRRIYVLIINNSDTNVYLAFGTTAVLNTGVRLNASGGSYEMNPDNIFFGAINGISGVAGKVVLVTEGT